MCLAGVGGRVEGLVEGDGGSGGGVYGGREAIGWVLGLEGSGYGGLGGGGDEGIDAGEGEVAWWDRVSVE